MNTKEISELRTIYVAVCDMNGILRGKRIPIDHLDKALNGEIRLPLSILSVDIWGADVVNAALSDGDIDGLSEPTSRGLIPIVHTKEPSALLPVCLANEDGSPYLGDARRVLMEICKKFEQLHLKPVIATELEFYLVDYKENTIPLPPISPKTGSRLSKTGVLNISDLFEFDEFLDEVYKYCTIVGIPADSAIAENGCGQFEINLLHTNDPIKAADDAMIFKQIVKSVALKHGWQATFMPKPFGDQSGSGFHIHCSIEDENGNNVFDNGTETGSEVLLHAVGGVLETMGDLTLLFAPNFNSYRRLRPDTHAPISIAWGYENRTAAIRIPGGPTIARRLEHRVSGADANPYLVCAAVLGGILYGIENKCLPPPATQGSTYEHEELKQLPLDWYSSIQRFEGSDLVKQIFPQKMIDLLVSVKKQEVEKFSKQITNFEYSTYLQDL